MMKMTIFGTTISFLNMVMPHKNLKIAFVVGIFPAASETFIIDQVGDLMDRGVEVEIFSFKKWPPKNISKRYYDYKMNSLTNYLVMPNNFVVRLIYAIPKIFKMILHNPSALFRTFNIKKYGSAARSLRLLYWVSPFINKKYDIYHCHFGLTADDFLLINDILHLDAKIVTSFYGFDVSRLVEEHGENIYDHLKKECSLFFVMSENMRKRVIALGFDPNKVVVHPVSINVEKYPFWERKLDKNQTVNIVSVGRFVEKKGFDDLLRALAIVKDKIGNKFKCYIIGDGPMKEELDRMTIDLNLNDVIVYKGMMPIDKIIAFFKDMHFFVQPSKTAQNGDME